MFTSDQLALFGEEDANVTTASPTISRQKRAYAQNLGPLTTNYKWLFPIPYVFDISMSKLIMFMQLLRQILRYSS
jgi:hypothetical protein